MAMKSVAKAAGISAGTALLAALSLPFLTNLPTPLLTFVGERLSPVPDYPFGILPFFSSTPIAPAPFVCDATHPYRTELVSLDPLVIYIHSLITPGEISALLRTAEPEFAPSEVTKNGRTLNTADRTSSSAGLPRDDPTVMCVLDRARNFLGTMLRDGWDEMGPPQLVRYRAGQKFNVHHDWYETPRWANDGSMRRWNRVASFFAILQDNCTGGETHFPYIRPSIVDQSPHGEAKWRGGLQDQIQRGEKEPRPLWREHENGGVAFRPVAGNAIFWINLHPNGTGDERTNHAGLPLVDGLKTAMNIWPRQYYLYD
ncbi:hypothetical protein QBC46DRAFT_420339 [Diplogelasinospora grovesii]|uniref:Prolyl 4-hydroxylase alpha subunit domain-containing protein n=1 Tax=Diplogelasinospora grovesii TaxID=303347 RepID=A0AAN6RZZ3_9PEZI|nr:hypothetical protein QBC46DRAFT_420339 [Diplogelasinospora grovesii]